MIAPSRALSVQILPFIVARRNVVRACLND